jgi:hypothetical protein
MLHAVRQRRPWLIFDVRQRKMPALPQLSAEFLLERLDVIGASAHERESGNETEGRMLAYLASHKKGNEYAMRSALAKWIDGGSEPKASMAKYLLNKLRL